MKSWTALAATAVALLMVATPAVAMGTGNPYQDHQVGVGYTVYQPSFVAGLGIQHVGRDQMCDHIGNGATVLATTINGAEATVGAYCDPASGR